MVVKALVKRLNEYDLPEQENDLMFVLPSLIITEEHREVVRKMNQRTIAELTAELILRYYENDPWPFLERFDDESLWYGPAEGQYIKGRKAMLDIWRRDEHDLTFTVGDMKVESTSANASSCNVMLSYPVVTHYPDGEDISVNQRLLLCWGERSVIDENGRRTKQPRILVCHISNPHPKHEDDVIYPKRFRQVYSQRGVMPHHKGERLHFRGVDRSDYFYLSDSILYIETDEGGMHSILHTADESVEIFDKVIDLAKACPHLFLRCHQSYLVNPNYIRNIRRFELRLTSDVVLPIPEKKYTAFRDQVTKFLKNNLSQQSVTQKE